MARILWMLVTLVMMEVSGESNGKEKLEKSNFSMVTSNDTKSMAKPLLRGRKDSPEVLESWATAQQE